MTKVKEAEITMQITNDILYVGVNDHQVDLFEGCLLYTSDAADEL